MTQHDTDFQRMRSQREGRRAALVTLLFWAASLAVGIWCIFYWKPPEDDTAIRELRSAIIAACAGTVAFGAFYAYLTRTNFDRVVREALAFSLGGDAKLFQQLDVTVRRTFVGANLQATLGAETGGAVFDNVVGPLMDNKTSYREQFSYEIEAFDEAPPLAGGNDGALAGIDDHLKASAEYFWLRQHLEYNLHKPVGRELKPHTGPLLVYFAFDEATLDRLMQRDEVFFREVLKLEPEDRDRLLALDDASLTEFLTQTLQFRMCMRQSKQQLPYVAQVERPAGAPPCIRVRSEPLPVEEQGGVVIDFVMPQCWRTTRFVVSLPQPTKDAQISFRRNKRMKNLEAVTYWSRMKEGQVQERCVGPDERGPIERAFKVDGWAFPTCGVIYFWDQA